MLVGVGDGGVGIMSATGIVDVSWLTIRSGAYIQPRSLFTQQNSSQVPLLLRAPMSNRSPRATVPMIENAGSGPLLTLT